MAKVNITPKIRKIAESGGLLIECTVNNLEIGDKVFERDSITIYEESSDYFVEYGIDDNFELYLISKPDYIEDLPAHIDSSVKLRSVVKFIVSELSRFS